MNTIPQANSRKRIALTVLAVPLLAAPSAYGVYRYLEPESGALAAASAAIGSYRRHSVNRRRATVCLA